jgi:thioredoxin reductase (NADPH)
LSTAKEYDIVIAGGGIAGLTAALTAARLGRRTLLLAGDVLGGNLLSIEKVEGYPGFPEGVPGYELCPMAQAAAGEAGAEFEMLPLRRLERKASGFRLTTAEGEVSAASVIIATGASPKHLDVPGAEEFVGKGVSHCASCDAPLLRGHTVAVVGGGDSAMQEALTLAGHVSKVVLLCRGTALAGQASYRARVLAEPKIEVRYAAEVEEISGNTAVTGVRLRGERTVLDAAAVFTYIGLDPNTAFLEPLVKLAPSGHIPTDSSMATQVPGVFAAGLARAGSPGRAVASAGEGAVAAAAADQFLRGHHP